MKDELYHIQFPKLGISLNINPTVFSIGNLNVKWYGLIIAAGFLLAFVYVMARSKFWCIKKEKLYDIIFVSTILAIISARIYYVIFFPGNYYKLHPEKIFAISEGGIAIYGAVIGGIFGTFVMCKITKQKFLPVLDLCCIGLTIGQCIGRWGNFTNQEAFGTATELPWGMLSENTNAVAVHPCFLYESVGCFIIFLILHFLSKNLKQIPGATFLLYTILYGILRAGIEGLRTDSLVIPGSCLRVSQVLAILLCGISSFLIFALFYKHKYKINNTK